jgi:hypothetical protein
MAGGAGGGRSVFAGDRLEPRPRHGRVRLPGWADHGGCRKGGGNLLVEIAGQALYLSPWLFIPVAIALVRALIRGPKVERDWFLALLAIGPIAVFTLLAIWSPGQPHWPMPGWLFALALPPLSAEPAFIRRFAIVSGAIVGAMALVFAVQGAGFGLAQATLQGWQMADPTAELVDWRALPQALAERGLLGPETFVAAPRWRGAGKASYALGPAVPVFCLCAEPHHFPFRADIHAAEGKDVILVWPASEHADWVPSLAESFDRVDPLDPVVVSRRGEPLHTLDLALGRHFRAPRQ